MKTYDELKDTVNPRVFSQWQEVDVEIYAFTYLGIEVVINDEYLGLVYANEVFEDYEEGQKLKGYIKCVRVDGKIDVSLHPGKGKQVPAIGEKIIDYLKAVGGKSEFNDKSAPDDIYDEFGVSKKVFKQAIGRLYKQGKIQITKKGIELK